MSAFRNRGLESRLVWIFGSPRSGSTWLMHLLGTSRRVVTFDEPGIGVHLGTTVSGVTGLSPRDVPTEQSRVIDFRRAAPGYFFSDRFQDAWRPLLRDLVLGRLAAQVERPWRPRRRIAVLKEPHGSYGADVLLAALPRSRVIFLLRDGRDVVDSGLDAATSDSWANRQQGGFESADQDRARFIRDRAHAWLWKVEIVQRAFDAHPPELRRLVRYEELLEDTESILTNLASWLGLPDTPEDLRRAVAELSFERIPADARGHGKFVRAATPGLWRKNLSSAEQELLLSIIGPKVEELGYA